LSAFGGSESGMQLPVEISKALGQSGREGRYVGAYAPIP
jgi:hypothetical protein